MIPQPYLVTIFLYLFVAILAALDAALVSYNLLPFHGGLRWLRVHFITLGVLTQLIFGLLPGLIARMRGVSRPGFHAGIWAALNAGIIVLLIGMPLLNPFMIFAGGALVFSAAVWMILHLTRLPGGRAPDSGGESISRRFYLAGLGYFLLGILVGTGIWLGWGEALRIKVPLEVHIHANNWGLISLVFSGLLIDLSPRLTGRPLASTQTLRRIFWMMAVGALGLILGPWTGALYFTVPGLILHLAATISLLVLFVRGFRASGRNWSPGLLHILLSYTWILAPILAAPMILLGVPGFPGAGIEQNAPQALVYGWVFQFGYPLLPFFFRRSLLGREDAELGGSLISLITINLGGVLLWASIFLSGYAGFLHGSAYLLWALVIVPLGRELWESVSLGFGDREEISI